MIPELQNREVRLLCTSVPPPVVVPARMGFANALIILFVIVQDWMLWVHTSVACADIARDVDGAIVGKAAAFADQVLRLVEEKGQERKAKLPPTSDAKTKRWCAEQQVCSLPSSFQQGWELQTHSRLSSYCLWLCIF